MPQTLLGNSEFGGGDRNPALFGSRDRFTRSDSVDHLAAKLSAAGRSFAGIGPRGVRASLQAYRLGVLRQARADAKPGPNGKAVLMRGGRKLGPNRYAGINLNATTNLKPGSPAYGYLTAKPQGPWKWLEYGTRPHPIVPGTPRKTQRFAGVLNLLTGQPAPAQVIYAGRGKRRGPRGDRMGKALRFDNGRYRRFANHPGARPKRTWTKGVEFATPNATAAFRATAWQGWSDAFASVAGFKSGPTGPVFSGGSQMRAPTRAGGSFGGTPRGVRVVTSRPARSGT